MPDTDEEWLTIADVAELAGVKALTITRYRVRPGAMPEPEAKFMQHPLWTRKTIEAWLKTRKQEAIAKSTAGVRAYWDQKKEKDVSATTGQESASEEEP